MSPTSPAPVRRPPSRLSRRTRLLLLAGVVLTMTGVLWAGGPPVREAAHHGVAFGFVIAAAWRALAMLLTRAPSSAPALPDDDLPIYTVLAPLYREAAMLDQLVRNLDALDYPRDRLQVMLVVEASDPETPAALHSRPLPTGFEVVVVPLGAPQTKPRACNHALALARGALITIYDAEDRPHPGQLREAAARFTHGPSDLGCLQAPLRIEHKGGFIPAQFANEYAALFEVSLPTLARFGVPFPLGGTSNHLRVDALRAAGGWNAYNVTEDAELGFRLAREGWRLGVLSLPTFENAPPSVTVWQPQRCRWLKGFIETVVDAAPRTGPRPRLWLGMLLTLVLPLCASLVHLPALLWLASYLLFGAMGGPWPKLVALDWIALVCGWSAAVLINAVGASRAGAPVRLRDALAAPMYWPLLSFAGYQALFRWAWEPDRWDKTDHTPWSPVVDRGTQGALSGG